MPDFMSDFLQKRRNLMNVFCDNYKKTLQTNWDTHLLVYFPDMIVKSKNYYQLKFALRRWLIRFERFELDVSLKTLLIDTYVSIQSDLWNNVAYNTGYVWLMYGYKFVFLRFGTSTNDFLAAFIEIVLEFKAEGYYESSTNAI